MRDQNERNAVLATRPQEFGHHLALAPFIEVGGRFICKQQPWRIDQRSRNPRPPLLSSRYLRGVGVQMIFEPDGTQLSDSPVADAP